MQHKKPGEKESMKLTWNEVRANNSDKGKQRMEEKYKV